MTPDEFMGQLRALVSGNRDREAIDLAGQHLRPLAPAMTPEQIVEVGDLMEWADMAIDLEESALRREQAAPDAQTPRSA
jgi:hypothetical protein